MKSGNIEDLHKGKPMGDGHAMTLDWIGPPLP